MLISLLLFQIGIVSILPLSRPQLNTYESSNFTTVSTTRIPLVRDNWQTRVAGLVERGQSLIAIGRFRRAIPLLEEALSIAVRERDRYWQILARGILGNALTVAGEYDRAIAEYQKSLTLARAIQNVELETTALNNLGNALLNQSQRTSKVLSEAQWEGDEEVIARLQQQVVEKRTAAISAFEEAVRRSNGTAKLFEAKALTNLARLLPEHRMAIKQLYQQKALVILNNLPASRIQAAELVALANDLKPQAAKKVLMTAIASARSSDDDSITLAFALGELGRIHEQLGELELATDFTQQALLAARGNYLYRWQWQLARILRAQGKTTEAIAAYKQAVNSLQASPGLLFGATEGLQFDFQSEVEFFYKELLSLLLDKNNEQQTAEAINYLKLFKLSELQDYFNDDCIEIKSELNRQGNVQLNSDEVTIYSIITQEKLYTILRLPNNQFKVFTSNITAADLNQEIQDLRYLLEDITTNRYLLKSQRMYDLLFRPLETEIAKFTPKTIVFVNDGLLKNVPMAALHDGRRFLIEKYALQTKLGLDLASPRIESEQLAVLFGLTMPIPPFSPLLEVDKEIRAIQKILGGSAFLNNQFTTSAFEKQIEKSSSNIIHIATHGWFGGTPENTFLLAADGRISLAQFQEILSKREDVVELLTLSACQTAVGDERAVLGLAGVAVRAGVQSAIASLWYASDRATQLLMTDFYEQRYVRRLDTAQALRQAQLELIAQPNYSHPSLWSGFILIQN